MSKDSSEYWIPVCDALLAPGPEQYQKLALLAEQGVPIATVALAWQDTPKAIALVENSGRFPELRATLALFEEARALLAAPPEEYQAYEALTALLPDPSESLRHYRFILSLAAALQSESDYPVLYCYQSDAVQAFSLLRIWRYSPQRFLDSLLGSRRYYTYVSDAGVYMLAAQLPQSFPMLRTLLERLVGYSLKLRLAQAAAHLILENLEFLKAEQRASLLYLLGDYLGRGETLEDAKLAARLLGCARQYNVNPLPMLAVLGERTVRDAPAMARRWTRTLLRAVPEHARADALYLRILALEGRLNQASTMRQWRWRKRAEKLIPSVENPLLRRSLELRQSAELSTIHYD